MSEYAEVLIYLLVALAVAVGMSFSSERLGPHSPGGVKAVSYESGVRPEMPVSHFSVRFYRVAMLFLVFDVAVMSIYPWAVNVLNLHAAGFYKALGFFVVVGLAFAYVWRRGGFKWD
jgi:NADH-quinone oxidoreductase subunit A